jgi:glycerol-3-phosphate dehydrogenase
VSRRNSATLWRAIPNLPRSSRKSIAILPGWNAALPDTLHATADLAETAGSCDVLIVGVPSAAFREVLTDAAPYVRPWIPVVSLTKGF